LGKKLNHVHARLETAGERQSKKKFDDRKKTERFVPARKYSGGGIKGGKKEVW